MDDTERQRLEQELLELQEQMQAVLDEDLSWSRERYSRLLAIYNLLLKRVDEYTQHEDKDD